MKTNYRTTLKMNWPQFVWLALALGVSLHDPGWKTTYPCTLKNADNEDLVRFSIEEDQLFVKFVPRAKLAYSLRRAFGWYNIDFDGERLSHLGCGEGARVLLEHVTISPGLSACHLGMNMGSQECSNLIRSKEPQACNNSLAAACCWMSHWRRQNKDDHAILPVSQHLLEYRQRVLCHLKLLDDQEVLVTKARSLFLAKPVDDVVAQRTSTLHGASTITQPSETALQYQGPSQSCPTKAEVREIKQSVEDAPLDAHHQSSGQYPGAAQVKLCSFEIRPDARRAVPKDQGYRKVVQSGLTKLRILSNRLVLEASEFCRGAGILSMELSRAPGRERYQEQK